MQWLKYLGCWKDLEEQVWGSRFRARFQGHPTVVIVQRTEVAAAATFITICILF